MRRLLLGVIVLVCALPAGAAALPGDPPIVVLSPDDGASAATDPDGIPVTFTCPLYRISDAGGGFVVYGGPRDYGASFSTSSTLGPDGRLADPVALGQGSEIPPTGSGQCTATFAAGGSQRPQETPGRYYWQVWRLCTGCPSGYETGPVRTLTLLADAKAAIRPPGRVYAGYPFALAVSLPGVTDGASVRLERRAGSRWKRLGGASALDERAELVLSLKRGRHTLRAVAEVGSQRVASPPRTIAVARAARWSTGGRDDGRYRGSAPQVSFRVTGGGRRIKGFSASVAMLCPGVTPGTFTTQIGTAAVRSIKVAPDGSFLAASTPDRATSILVRGRLAGGRVKGGRVQLSVGPCSGDLRYSARR